MLPFLLGDSPLLGSGDIFLVLIVGAELRKSELDPVLMEKSLERDIKLSHVVIAGTSEYYMPLLQIQRHTLVVFETFGEVVGACS